MDLDIKTFMYINLLITVMGLVPVITASEPEMLKISGPDKVVAGVISLFTCSANCSPPCFYTWSMEGRTFKHTGSTLNLTADGLYKYETVICFVTNDYAHHAVESKLIRVINPYSVRPNKDPKERQPYNLTCNGASPPATITWIKDDAALMLDSRMSLSSDNTTLMFSILKETDNGKYQCKVFKGSVGVLSVKFHIDFSNVRIVSLSGPDRVEVGVESEFTCDARCGVDCTVNWSLSAIPKGRFIVEGPTILWTPSYVGQTQNITCIALNPSSGKVGPVTKYVTVVAARSRPGSSDAASVKPSVAAVSSAALIMLVSGYF